jgi:hypothetical protein
MPCRPVQFFDPTGSAMAQNNVLRSRVMAAGRALSDRTDVKDWGLVSQCIAL